MNKEQGRIMQKAWKKWGPYLTERQWGTVREDYSPDENPWTYSTHDMARSKAYRWGEEGIAGICDDRQLLCFAIGLWNTRDPILKERFFGLTGPQGNHGEDVKEIYYHLDSTPSHAYMKMLYKYPQTAFPYDQLLAENAKRTRLDPEYELIDTGIFDQNRYFDVFVEYAKNDTEDILIRIQVVNRGLEAAPLVVLPTLWFRNTWIWGYDSYEPTLMAIGDQAVEVKHRSLPGFRLLGEKPKDLLFCDNETNVPRLYHSADGKKYYKDGINDYIVQGKPTVNPDRGGTKMSFHYELQVPAGTTQTLRLRLGNYSGNDPFGGFDGLFQTRIGEADEFYGALQQGLAGEEEKTIQRQAFGGLLWGKQFYYYDVTQWLKGDPAQPVCPVERMKGRNHEWRHLNNADVISMPDKWEYPWYASWDLAFHCIPLAMIDPGLAKRQLLLLTHDWYLHPNGQLPAYEWSFSDANPPVHAWATWKVYELDKEGQGGKGDTGFLETIFHKLLLNFTWWVNRKDASGNNIFEGGFLGMDNIGLFDRNNTQMPDGSHLEQADGTSWMAMYSLNLMRIALELAKTNPIYQDMATKFFEHFLYIAGVMDNMGDNASGLWDDQDEFFYDIVKFPDDGYLRLKIRSMVGLIPLLAVEVLDDEILQSQSDFSDRLRWFLNYRPDLASLVSRWHEKGAGEKHLLSLLRGHRMKRLLFRMLDETEFLSEFGIRALSKYHEQHPFQLDLGGNVLSVPYTPGESTTGLFGGNSNWRGPVWVPLNFMIIESLRRFHHYYGDDFLVEYPTHSGNYLNLDQIAHELSMRLLRLFQRNAQGTRPIFGNNSKMQGDPYFKDHFLFYEYFHGDKGWGLGASHQTGWTALIAKLIQTIAKKG